MIRSLLRRLRWFLPLATIVLSSAFVIWRLAPPYDPMAAWHPYASLASLYTFQSGIASPTPQTAVTPFVATASSTPLPPTVSATNTGDASFTVTVTSAAFATATPFPTPTPPASPTDVFATAALPTPALPTFALPTFALPTPTLPGLATFTPPFQFGSTPTRPRPSAQVLPSETPLAPAIPGVTVVIATGSPGARGTATTPTIAGTVRQTARPRTTSTPTPTPTATPRDRREVLAEGIDNAVLSVTTIWQCCGLLIFFLTAIGLFLAIRRRPPVRHGLSPAPKA